MKGNLKRVLSLVLVFIMIAAMAACGGKSEKENAPANKNTDTAAKDAGTSKTPEKELYKVDVFTMLGNMAGVQTGWFAKIVKDKFNMELNMIASNVDGGGDNKFATMMASGNLGDIVIFGGEDDKYRDAIKSGLLYDMAKDGLIEKYGKDIVSGYPKAIEKAKVNFGGGKSIYGLGYNAANMPSGPSEGSEMTWGPDLRWDLYEKLGKPEIKTMEDYLPVLKKMQELEPKSDTGKPTYGFSMWADWDGNLMCLAKQFACMNGYDETDQFNPGGFALISANQEKTQGLLDPDGLYLRTLKLYFKANQMGLVDPDSISQKYEDAVNKMKDGQTLFSWFPWMDNIYNTPERQAQGKGFALVPFKDEKIYSLGFNPYGYGRLISIGSKAKDPARVMEFINWMYTPEGILMSSDTPVGPKGLTWDVKDGKPYLTDFGKKALPKNPIDIPAEYGGGNFKDGINQMNINLVQITAIHPDFNEPYDWRLWKSVLSDNPSKLVQNWRASMNALTPKEYLQKNNMLVVNDPVFTGKAPDTIDKTLQQKQGQAAAVIKQYSWKMIFAKNEAEFDKLFKEMSDKAKGLGYDEVLQWYVDRAKQVYDFRQQKK
ncbi:MAG: extracellular solute-binding protein [Clostridia bacterium]|nr:extracellular solute-binding protein [Clostridia bacterium]